MILSKVFELILKKRPLTYLSYGIIVFSIVLFIASLFYKTYSGGADAIVPGRYGAVIDALSFSISGLLLGIHFTTIIFARDLKTKRFQNLFFTKWIAVELISYVLIYALIGSFIKFFLFS
jgi:hypothetical protein